MPVGAVVAVGLVAEEGVLQDFDEIGLPGVAGEEVDTAVVGLVVDGEREVPVVVEWGFG
ncbi:hypothetical protein [Natrinema limicola]|uniref:hypothetical protein n=1 Tax=Natrinema limicola TaxID=370323 RepID=UPI00135F16F8|nr:hypothetical protein [Natrinema limicola]